MREQAEHLVRNLRNGQFAVVPTTESDDSSEELKHYNGYRQACEQKVRPRTDEWHSPLNQNRVGQRADFRLHPSRRTSANNLTLWSVRVGGRKLLVIKARKFNSEALSETILYVVDEATCVVMERRILTETPRYSALFTAKTMFSSSVSIPPLSFAGVLSVQGQPYLLRLSVDGCDDCLRDMNIEAGYSVRIAVTRISGQERLWSFRDAWPTIEGAERPTGTIEFGFSSQGFVHSGFEEFEGWQDE